MTRIPELEQELVAAAARLRSPRRLARPAVRALAIAAALGVLLLAVVVREGVDESRQRVQPTKPPPPASGVKIKDDLEAGIGFRLDGRIMTVLLRPEAPDRVRSQVANAYVWAVCGARVDDQGASWRTGEREWIAGKQKLRLEFPRDISGGANWCRLKALGLGNVAFIEFGSTPLVSDSPAERSVEQIVKEWAVLFAMRDPAWCNYVGQPLCERAGCQRVGGVPIEHCTPIPPEYQRSFSDAAIEDVAVDGTASPNRATVSFSNGETLQLVEDTSGLERPNPWWMISKIGDYSPSDDH